MLLRSAKDADASHEAKKELGSSSGGAPSAQPTRGVVRAPTSAATVLRVFVKRPSQNFLFVMISASAIIAYAFGGSERPGGFQIIGPGGGGAMFHPTISPHDPNTALVSCDMTGSYITHDGGHS